MYKDIKKRVYDANIELVEKGVVIYTWGNVSEVDRERNIVVIKPSGVDYDKMTYEDMVVLNLKTGEKIEGDLNPSSDTPTHLEIYRNFKNVGGVTHTHSTNAVAFAQAGVNLPALGTTHADYFFGDIPCTRELNEAEVVNDYELNTGKVIIETFNNKSVDPLSVPGVLVKNHGPFAFGKDAKTSVYHAVVMEKVAEIAIKTLVLNKNATLQQYILDKHYYRKHGEHAYYGQK